MAKGKMAKNDIEEFISKSIDQIKSGIPKDCTLTGNFDFDISVMTTKETEGKLDIILADFKHSSNIHLVHRLKFSITDKKSRDENAQFVYRFLKDLTSDLIFLQNF